MKPLKLILLLSMWPLASMFASGDTLKYKLEMSANVSTGSYAPMWFTANRYGLSGIKPKSGYVRAGVDYAKKINAEWHVEAGLDLAGAVNQTSPFVVQQAFVDFTWRKITLSIGSKERGACPLDKDMRLSSGMMVEGPNARPISQVRFEVKEYQTLPYSKGWLAAKCHFGYGWFTDGDWRADFVKPGETFTKNVIYHSKSMMIRVGNPEKTPVTMEIGMIEAAQFGGSRWRKNADGTVTCVARMPGGVKDYLKAIIPIQKSTLENVEGNHVGSWNFALNYTAPTWKVRCYYEHYFDDHSQLTWQYGRWKDGHIGVEVTLPKNPFVTKVLWEGLCTTDQTGPLLYDGVGGSFHEIQMSGGDNYYNHDYNWQHWGMGIGHPFLPGPIYNADGTNMFRSNRVKAHHIGIGGNPSDEWSYRLLLSYMKHWGTYKVPLDRMMRQGSTLAEVMYKPKKYAGWNFSLALGYDKGSYIGDSMGCMVTITKTGLLWSR